MRSREKVRFAVLGCGVISEFHIEAIVKLEETELVAICDVSEEYMKKYTDQYSVRTYTDYDELLSQDDIDVVCICTPSGMHPEQTIKAAKAGKHVICEKPMALKIEDTYRMIEMCEQNEVKLAAVFPWRMSPVVQYVREFIQGGGLGKLSLCSAYIKPFRKQAYYDKAGWRGTWAIDGGGVLMNQGIHTVDMLQWIAGPVASCYGQIGAVLRNIEVEDTAISLLNFKNGAMGVIEASTTAYKTPDSLTFHGENGTLILSSGEITKLELVEGEVEIPIFEAFKVIPDGHRLQIRDMALAIREDREPIVTGRDGIQSLEIILGTYESSRNQRKKMMS
ncbi:Gfo/Idh/MocA family protein [Radiobacillus sp. PE A8.2]|uniref:Gfo/Idh/MocA family protein n=1 Tax=Radiobacillus sp. PE A8.2 TaxID=3380349 RepID=UPI00388D045D